MDVRLHNRYKNNFRSQVLPFMLIKVVTIELKKEIMLRIKYLHLMHSDQTKCNETSRI